MSDEIKKIVEDLFDAARIEIGEVQIKSDLPAKALAVNVAMDEAGPFIGENGANLKDWEYILRLIIKKKFPDFSSVVFDINGYRKEKEELIRGKARQAAKEAAMKKESVTLDIMNAYERRLVHMELAGRPDIITESIGREPIRRVVVKPYP